MILLRLLIISCLSFFIARGAEARYYLTTNHFLDYWQFFLMTFGIFVGIYILMKDKQNEY